MKNSLLLLAAVLLAPMFTLHAAAKPNILYIVADDLGYNDVAFNGSKEIKTPNLDKLAHDGTILKSFYAQPLCSTSRASLLTGRYPCHTGIYSVVRPDVPWGLPLEERTLAQALKEAGYETAIVGKWHLGDQPAYLPTRRGFDHQYGLWTGNIDYFTHMRNGKLDWHRDDKPCNDQGYSTHLIAKEACRLIQEKDPDKPLFLYLPFNAVHYPHQVPDSYTVPYANLSKGRRVIAGMCAAMDEAVGQVIAALEAKGIRDNTLILFNSDNGGPGGNDNSPLSGFKGSINEGGIRVCAFASWPGHIPSNAICNEILHEVDWYFTLIDLVGGSLQQKLPLDGRDIWPVLTQGAKSPHADTLTVCGTAYGKIAVRSGDWKLLVQGQNSKKGPPELFNLADDIGEKKNLAVTHPENVKELMAKYEAVMKTAVEGAGGKASGQPLKDHEED